MLVHIYRLLTEPMVAIIAGPDRKTYYAHRDLLCQRSDYFRAALTGQFQESQNNRFEFPHQEPAAIETFLCLIYRFGPSEKITLGYPKTHAFTRRLVSMCSFARTILLEDSSNACADSIRAYFRHTFGAGDTLPLTAMDLSMLWEYDVGSKLCTRLCLALSLRMKRLSKSCNLSPEILQLVGQGGELAVTLTKSLVICQRDLTIGAGSMLSQAFDCLFHDHRTTRLCSIPTHSDWTLLMPELREALEYVG